MRHRHQPARRTGGRGGATYLSHRRRNQPRQAGRSEYRLRVALI